MREAVDGQPAWTGVAPPAIAPPMGMADLASVLRERLADQQRAMQPAPMAQMAPMAGLQGAGGLPVDVLARLIESNRAAAAAAAEAPMQVPAGNQMAMQLIAMMAAQQQQGQQQGR